MKWLHRIGRSIVSLFVVTTVIFFLAAFVFGDILLLFLPPLVWIVAVNFPFGRTVCTRSRRAMGAKSPTDPQPEKGLLASPI
jgi:hypothetical protein